ncbi:hypothetical protein TorRG33x02_175950 [Trema orientale]|uniref:RNase H type-1 domain-containing protein n=1 Tax=Trema orientale TaxID=63057 RepID=A0A2P5ELV1_TREOI|nr:hypothetical protein TorRG33x02_175950 [Trema orientale]
MACGDFTPFTSASVAEGKVLLGAIQVAVNLNVSAVIFEGYCAEVFLELGVKRRGGASKWELG